MPFPFSAVTGADDMKLALVLAAIDPAIGGVLLRGEKGTAKSTLARSVAALLPGDAPFAELPLGATEERVVGSIDLAAALGGNEVRFSPGLLAEADGGVLYVDEVNLLADHLVDVLLDSAASGRNLVERDGLSHEHSARFVLIGSMNPEEGDLRPQLLDRFGLAVEVHAPLDPAVRAEVVRRRLAFDADPTGFAAAWAAEEQELAERLASGCPAHLDDELLVAISSLCAAAGAEGLRADLVLARAAAANAGWDGRTETTADDVRLVAPLVLAHRQRRHPLDPPDADQQRLDDALDDALGPPPEPGGDPTDQPDADDTAAPDRTDAPDPTPDAVAALRAARVATAAPTAGRRSPVTGPRGRTIADRAPNGTASGVAVVATARTAAARRAADPTSPAGIVAADLREPVREAKAGNLLVLAVDASGSMGAADRMAAVKGALLGLLVDAYQRRDRVALVTFRGDGAEVALAPTASVELARRRLEDLPTGGETPLAEGIRTAADLADRSTTDTLRPLLVVVTDGRATGAGDAVDAAILEAAVVRHRGVPSVVVDVEDGSGPRLGLAARLAEALGAHHLPLGALTAPRLEAALRSVTVGAPS